MLTNLLNRRVTLGRLILVLLFASGLIFAGTYSGYVVKTEAENSSCCGSDATCSDSTDGQPQTANCCGSEPTNIPSVGTDTPGSVSDDDDPCTCIDSEKCGSTSCDPEDDDCSVMKCPTGCGGDCGCTAQCGSYDCGSDDPPFPCPGSDTRSPE